MSSRRSERIISIDLLRGIVMVVMALDHSRNFFSNPGYDPTDLSRTTIGLFLTRWISNFCAPIFILLAGTGAYRSSRRKTKRELSFFLATRGLWLAFLEISAVQFAWFFEAPFGERPFYFGILWAIGLSMVGLAALIHLPLWGIATFGVATILGHNLTDGVQTESFGRLATLWNVLHVSTSTPIGVVVYPVWPWMGVMALGFALGSVYDWEPRRRSDFLFWLGLGMLTLFAILRIPNLYGNPYPWNVQSSDLRSALSVLNVHKYPPSADYLLMTLGPAMLFLSVAERVRWPLERQLVTIGRVPLFFYLLHLYWLHIVATLVALAFGFDTSLLRKDATAIGWGFGLPVVYGAWIGTVIVLYPACAWFARIKARRANWWLSYL